MAHFTIVRFYYRNNFVKISLYFYDSLVFFFFVVVVVAVVVVCLFVCFYLFCFCFLFFFIFFVCFLFPSKMKQGSVCTFTFNGAFIRINVHDGRKDKQTKIVHLLYGSLSPPRGPQNFSEHRLTC